MWGHNESWMLNLRGAVDIGKGLLGELLFLAIPVPFVDFAAGEIKALG